MKPASTATLEHQTRTAMTAGDWAAVADLERHLDRAEAAERRTPHLLPSALWYASIGVPVFRLMPGRKKPFPRSHGLHDATTDAQQLRAWWTETPNANIGLATGHRFDVIDIDGPTGVLSWARLEELPPTLGVVNTPRPGGSHLYISPSGNGNKAGIAAGIDYRGLGGYVVAPPSATFLADDLTCPGTYTWRSPLIVTDIAEVA